MKDIKEASTKNKSKTKAKPTNSDSDNPSSARRRRKRKESKKPKNRSGTPTLASSIVDHIEVSETDTIATEIISESFNKSIESDIKTLNDEEDESTTSRTSSRTRSRSHSRSSSRTANSSSRTPRKETALTSETKSSQFLRSNTSHKSPKSPKSYIDDFENTDQDVTVSRVVDKRKQLSFATDPIFDKAKTKSKTATATTKTRPSGVASSNAEVQVDTADLLKYSHLLKSVSMYNPSSLLLATVSHFDHVDHTATLRDLNQLTGYNMINQTFNDLIKYNLNFMKNFLAAQRSLYEQQIQSIQPTFHSN